MHKKILSLLVAAVMTVGFTNVVLADELPTPKIVVNDRLIAFEDQEPVISENGDTLIPLRGVFEAMGAQVTWNGEERSVYVKAKDNIVRIKMWIDNPVMTKYTLTSVTTVDNEEITATTAPQIMNDRTMVPLRIVSENFGALVDWFEDTRLITIDTKEYQKFIASKTISYTETEEKAEYDPKQALPYLYIEADKTTALVGDKIKVDVKLANSDKMEGYSKFSGMTAALFYDDEVLNCSGNDAVVGGAITKSILGASNAEFYGDSIKYVYIVYPNATDVDTKLVDGTIASFTFDVTADAETKISLSNRITAIGVDTSVLVADDNDKNESFDASDELHIDVTPIVINSK